MASRLWVSHDRHPLSISASSFDDGALFFGIFLFFLNECILFSILILIDQDSHILRGGVNAQLAHASDTLALSIQLPTA